MRSRLLSWSLALFLIFRVAIVFGAAVPGKSKITVQVSNLRSDRSQRDRFIQPNILRTSQFPVVEFIPVEIRGLPSPLPTHGTHEFEIIGDLTIQNQTRRVTWTATGTFGATGMRIEARETGPGFLHRVRHCGVIP